MEKDEILGRQTAENKLLGKQCEISQNIILREKKFRENIPADCNNYLRKKTFGILCSESSAFQVLLYLFKNLIISIPKSEHFCNFSD